MPQPVFFRLKRPVLFQSDYGAFLSSGMLGESRKRGQRAVQRTGPFMPPLTVLGLATIVVSDEFRTSLRADFRGLKFRSVIKDKITEVHWEEWAPNADEPQFYPPSGEPEGYVTDYPHSPDAAEKLGDIWQIVLGEGAKSRTERGEKIGHSTMFIDGATWNGADFFYVAPHTSKIPVVSDRARQWLQREVPRWVRLEPVVTE